jgi:hypothetical protein
VKRGDDAASTELVSVEKFKDFVRRVVSVPKKEIDRRLAEQRRQRTKRSGRK